MSEKHHDEPKETKGHHAAEPHTVGSIAAVKGAATLLTEIVAAAKAAREAVAELREKYAAFKAKAGSEKLSVKDELALGSVMNQVEEELNKLDPDCPVVT